MAEGLLAGSKVRLFGQVVTDMTFTPTGGDKNAVKKVFARIYGFSFEGQFTDLAPPSLFLVPDNGQKVEGTLESSGMAKEEPELVDKVLVWQLDRDDFSVRLQEDSGPLDRILLQAAFGSEALHYAGQDVRMRAAGQDVRLRFAGQDIRLRGRSGGVSD